MTPPQPPRPRLVPPLRREEEAESEVREVAHRPAHQIAQGPAATEADRIDALVEDVRDMAPRVRRVDRRTKRTARVLLGVSSVTRSTRRELRAARLEEAEARGKLAGDIARALVPQQKEIAKEAAAAAGKEGARRASVTPVGAMGLLVVLIQVFLALLQKD